MHTGLIPTASFARGLSLASTVHSTHNRGIWEQLVTQGPLGAALHPYLGGVEQISQLPGPSVGTQGQSTPAFRAPNPGGLQSTRPWMLA